MSQCKIRNCINTALQEKGRYARLCDAHKEEIIKRNGSSGSSGSRRKKTPEPPKLKDTAIRLIELSERIDNHAADFRQSKNQLLIDINHFHHVLEELKMGLKNLVTDNAN